MSKNKFFTENSLIIQIYSVMYYARLGRQYLTYGFLIPLLVDELGLNFWLVTLCVSTPIAKGLATIFTYKVDNPIRKYLYKKIQS